MIIIFCTKCGKEIADDVKFCGECGNNVGGQSTEGENSVETMVVHKKTMEKTKERAQIRLPKQKLSILIIGLIILIGITVFAKDALIYTMSPEKYVLLSMNNTYKSISKDVSKMRTMFLSDISPRDSVTNTIKISVDSISTDDPWADEELRILNGSGLELSTSMDKNKKEIQLSGKSIYNGRDFVSINGKLNDDELQIYIPELYNRVFTLPSRDFGKRWNQSDLAAETYSYLDESLDISYSNLIGDGLTKEMDGRTKSDYDKVLNKLISNARFEKNGSMNLNIGDKFKKCNRTSVNIGEKQVKESLLLLLDAIEKDNRIEELKETFRKTNQDYVAREFDEIIYEARYNIEEYFSLDKFKLDIYTNSGKVVKMELSIMPDADYREDTIKLSMDLLGEKSLIDDFKLELLVGEDEGRLVYTSKGNHLGHKNLFTDDTKLVIYDYGREMLRLSSNMEIELSKETDNLSYSADFNADDISFRFKTQGDFSSSSDKIDYNLRNISLTTKDYYENSIQFKGNLGLKAEKGSKNITNIENVEKSKLLDIMGYDLYEIMSEIESNVYNIIY